MLRLRGVVGQGALLMCRQLQCRQLLQQGELGLVQRQWAAVAVSTLALLCVV